MKVSDFCTCGVGKRCDRCTPTSEIPTFLRPQAPAPVRPYDEYARPTPPVDNIHVAMGCEQFSESILQEAHRLTHGPRQADYGHPLDDYTCTAAVASALLSRKLKEPITPDEMALIMVGVKLSRQSRQKKRDNTVDGAGYFWVAQECLDEQERREKISTTETK